MIEFTDAVTPLKNKAKIVIFGPYGKGGRDRLELLKEFLRTSKFSKADTVVRLPAPPGINRQRIGDDDIYFTKKSQYYVKKFEIGLFVFFKDISHESVTVEVKELVDKYPEKIKCASFMAQEDKSSLATLERGTLKNYNRDIGIFNNCNDLNELAEKACTNHIIEDDCVKSRQLLTEI